MLQQVRACFVDEAVGHGAGGLLAVCDWLLAISYWLLINDSLAGVCGWMGSRQSIRISNFTMLRKSWLPLTHGLLL